MPRVLFVILMVAAMSLTGVECSLAADPGSWTVVRKIQGFYIEHRVARDSRFPQVRVTVVIQAPPSKVYAVISDYDHFSEFVPYVRDSRTIADQSGERLIFQRLHFPGPLADRSYVIRATRHNNPIGKGSYREEWALVKKQDAVDELTGLVPKAFSGFWELTPVQGGAATEATYSIHMDPGGYWPAWLITPAVNRYLPQAMLAVMDPAAPLNSN